jgi:hypothetical protein
LSSATYPTRVANTNRSLSFSGPEQLGADAIAYPAAASIAGINVRSLTGAG